MSMFALAVGRNKRINRLKESLSHGIYAIDTGALIKELEGLHATRSFRNLTSKEVLQDSQRKIIDSSLQNSAYRSRAVAIKMQCFRISRLLDEHTERAFSYISVKYVSQLKNEHSTIAGRNQAVKLILEDFYSLHHKLQTVMQLADMLISDMDQTAWATKHIVDMLNLSYSRERNL